MKLKDTENLFRGLKSDHLTEEELGSYHNRRLDPLGQKLADAHLRQCLICQVRVENRKITAEDDTMIKRAMQARREQKLSSDSTPSEDRARLTPRGRLSDYLQQIMERWTAFFMQQEAVRSATRGLDPIWEGTSEDGVLKVYAFQEDDAGLTIHFSSADLSLEGLRFNVSLGSASRDITLEINSGSELHAQFEVARNQLPVSLASINIRPIS